MNRYIAISGAVAMLAAFQSTRAASVTAFSTDFNAGVPAEFSGAGAATSVGGYAGFGFSGDYLRNDSSSVHTVLTLAGLPAHTSLDLDFLVAIIDSWDGDGAGAGCCDPDFLNVAVDGTEVFENSFNNVWGFGFGGFDSQGYPRGANELKSPATGDIAHNSTYPDAAYDMGLDSSFAGIAHSSSSLVIEWWADGGGWQAGIDESFAIDNVTVTLNGVVRGVPDSSSTASLLALGCCLLALAKRRFSSGC